MSDDWMFKAVPIFIGLVALIIVCGWIGIGWTISKVAPRVVHVADKLEQKYLPDDGGVQ
jgi:hypothetical protein